MCCDLFCQVRKSQQEIWRWRKGRFYSKLSYFQYLSHKKPCGTLELAVLRLTQCLSSSRAQVDFALERMMEENHMLHGRDRKQVYPPSLALTPKIQIKGN